MTQVDSLIDHCSGGTYNRMTVPGACTFSIVPISCRPHFFHSVWLFERYTPQKRPGYEVSTRYARILETTPPLAVPQLACSTPPPSPLCSPFSWAWCSTRPVWTHLKPRYSVISFWKHVVLLPWNPNAPH